MADGDNPRLAALVRLVRVFSWALVWWAAGFAVCLALGEDAYSIAVGVMFFIDGALLVVFRRMLREEQINAPEH